MTWFTDTVTIEIMSGPFAGTVTEAPGRSGAAPIVYWVRRGEDGLEIRSGDLGPGEGEGWVRHISHYRLIYGRRAGEPIPVELW